MDPITYRPPRATDVVALVVTGLGAVSMLGVALAFLVDRSGLDDTIVGLVFLGAACALAVLAARQAPRTRNPQPALRLDARGVTFVGPSGQPQFLPWADIRNVASGYRFMSKSGHRVVRLTDVRGQTWEIAESAIGASADDVTRDVERFRAEAR